MDGSIGGPSTDSGSDRAELSTVCPHSRCDRGRRPPPRSLSRSTGRWPDRASADLAVETGQHEPPADQLGGGHHVRVGDPPGDRPVGLDRERLDLGLDDDVGEARRSRAGRSSASPTDGPSARLAGRRLEAVGVEPVGDDEQAGGRPSGAPVARRGSATRSGRSRRRAALRVQLGAAQRVGSAATRGPRSIELAARLGQGEDLGRRAAAAPPPAGAQAARGR